MIDDNNTRYFNGWWAILFLILSFNLIPIPIALSISTLGAWVYQNPILVDMNYLGEVNMHPIADNLTSILTMIVLVSFILWRMKVRNISFDTLGSFHMKRNDLFLGTLFLFFFIGLEEIYMLLLGIEMPKGFIDFMLSEPLILGLISVIIIAPIAEEFIFRGFLYSQLKITKLGSWGAVTVSSLLWTVIHFQYEPLILVILFIFGIFLGYIRMAYSSLVLPIALHAINNSFAFMMAYFLS
jgi:membrane protease YdiL (CAAX protease family)